MIDALVASIVKRLRPDLVLLFGSRARGETRDDSDYDIMVVVPDGAHATECRTAAHEVLRTRALDADIEVRTTAEYTRRRDDPGFVDWVVAREGRVLYTTGAVAQSSGRVLQVREQPSEGMMLWIERANGDFQAAKASVASNDPPWATIGFLGHSCVEKLLKAMVIRQGRYPPRTHDLTELLSLLPSDVSGDAELRTACQLLQAIYPKAPQPIPTPEEGGNAFEAASGARARLLTALGR